MFDKGVFGEIYQREAGRCIATIRTGRGRRFSLSEGENRQIWMGFTL